MTTSRSFTLLCTVGVFCFISYNMVRMPVLALFAESLGASPERVGLIVSVSTLTGVFLKLPSGAKMAVANPWKKRKAVSVSRSVTKG